MKYVIGIVLAVLALVGFSAMNSYNGFVSLQEGADAEWSNVETQYQRRYDLIPNLVATVQGAADFEKETLTAVTEARAKVGSIQAGKGLLDNPQKLQQFQAAQSELGSALQRLMVVVERYPDLKANQNFLALQSQLEGTENRISVARRDFIQAVNQYNREIRTFPGRIWHSILYSDMPLRETYEATSQNTEQAPTVDFND